MTTKSLATCFLSLGSFILILGIGLSVSATPNEFTLQITTSNYLESCSDCHQQPHENNWQVSPHNLTLASYTPTPTNCLTCHNPDSGSTNTSLNISDPASKLLILRHRLAVIRANNPAWHTTAANVPSPEQLLAQQIETTLNLVEANEEWGFHSSAYINNQLADAEALLLTLESLS